MSKPTKLEQIFSDEDIAKLNEAGIYSIEDLDKSILAMDGKTDIRSKYEQIAESDASWTLPNGMILVRWR